MELCEAVKKKLDHGLICITGQGASGKTELAKKLARHLNAGLYSFDCLYIPDYLRRKYGITGCHPDAVHKSEAVEVLSKLRSGKDAPIYTAKGKKLFKSGTYHCQKYNIIDGLGAVHFLDYFDLVIFVECDVEVEKKRRFERDTKERGKNPEDVKKVFLLRRKQYEEFVLPKREKADILVKSGADYKLSLLA